MLQLLQLLGRHAAQFCCRAQRSGVVPLELGGARPLPQNFYAFFVKFFF